MIRRGSIEITRAVMIALTVALCLSAQTTTKSLPDLIEEVRPTIVQIGATFPDGESRGTGFFVNEHFVVTAAHVVSVGGKAPQHISVFVRAPSTKVQNMIQFQTPWLGVAAEIAAVDDINDIVLLSIGQAVFTQRVAVIQGKGIVLTGKTDNARIETRTLRDGASAVTPKPANGGHLKTGQ